MNKEKKLEIFLAILIFLLINYATYRYFFFSRYNNLLAQKEEFTQKWEKVKKLKLTEKKIEGIKKENEKLKKDIELMNKLTSNQIDTPQLIYDFYYSCIKYGINGEEMKFDLLPSDNKDEEQSANKIEEKNKKDGNSSKEKDNSSEINYISDDIVRLSITLKVNGDKYKIEKYINNLNSITERKLNVKSVRLFSKTEEEKEKEEFKRENELLNNDGLDNKKDINFNNNKENEEDIAPSKNNDSLENDSFILVKDKIISCEIVFYQYIRVTGENYDSIKNYAFYNKKIGFKSIADMFGSKKRSR